MRHDLSEKEARAALAHFGPPWSLPETRLRAVGQGWSGGWVCHVCTPHEEAALRRFPQSASPERIAWIHSVQKLAYAHGCFVVPEIHSTRDGQSFASDNGLWELSSWRPGTPADFDEPLSEHVRQTVFLAQHWYQSVRPAANLPATAASESFQSLRAYQTKSHLPSPGVRRRIELAREALCFRDPVAFVTPFQREILERTRRAIERTQPWFDSLEGWADTPLPMEIALRDLHREHVLFDRERVTGLIDFGSIGIDTPAIDLARYLSSFRSLSLQSIKQTHPVLAELCPASIQPTDWSKLVETLLVTGVALSCHHWRQWVMVEQRPFPSHANPLDRWTERLHRIETLLAESPRPT